MKSDAAAQFYQLKKGLLSKKQNTDQIKKTLSAVTPEQVETFFQQFLENDVETAMEETFQISKYDARKPFYANFIRKLVPCVLKKNVKYKLMEQFFQQLLKYLKDQNQQYET